MTTYIEVRIPGDMASFATAARKALAVACGGRRKADGREAVRALRRLGSSVWGTPAWEELRRAADRIELRLHAGQPWVRVAREQAEVFDAMLRAMSGEEVEGSTE